ncbi:hypothetical protein BASA50_001352 [Batrachochytrium salamandrivorans]|uniref:non-specific serine/threonine protein kinase n=1 Tax=Batrachochytrium salamandrivorans TaxID=1357716 RepID=A0ABQ8EVB3_9FUNG|nr:hypothetical protein BASA50_001352 [Batrachochytrium salamandrivorans]
MFDPLLWVLHHFVTHYAGQTNQGNTNDDDDANQPSGSKDAASLIHRTDSLKRGRELRKIKASSSVNSQLGKECKGRHGIRKIFGSCPQQQSPPGSQPSTSYDPPQSDEMPLPRYVRKSAVESYYQGRNADQYNAFVESEENYFTSRYLFKKELGKGKFGTVYLAIKKSNGFKVACKSILKSKIDEYTLELSPPPRCHIPNPLSHHKKLAAAQCMSPRPLDLFVPHEAVLQMYLSRPGHENPYVPKALDYITLENEFILVMDYLDEEWVTIFNYLKKKGPLDIEVARDILREIVNAVISLKQQGVFHNDLHVGNILYNLETGRIKLIDFGATNVISGWKERKLLQSLDSSSTAPKYKAGIDELRSMQRIGQLIFRLLTGIRLYKDDFNYGEFMRKIILPDPDPSQSELKEKAIHLVDILVSQHCYSAHPFAHLVVECEQVTGHRIQSGLVPAIQKSRLRLLGRALDPGVENVYTWLRGGVINGEADLDQRWLDGTVEYESMGTRS